MNDEGRPDPDELLKAVRREEQVKSAARFRLFLGMSAGVGKTYAMLKAAQQLRQDGVDVVVGIAVTHGRAETAALLEGLERVPLRKIEHRGAVLEELDVDALIRRRPRVAIVDELAHSNAPGSRHAKRYQDVLELLDAGIDVYAALNVQHLESRKDSVEAITQVAIRETVPDSILERTTQVELVDIAPVELLKRLREGKVYKGERAERAIENFFREDKLTALREIALRLTAERVDQDLQRFPRAGTHKSPWRTNERLMIAVSHSPYSETLVRAGRRVSYNLEAPWIAVHVDIGIALTDADQLQLSKNLALARELGAETIATSDVDVASALARVARQRNVTQILVGRPTRRWFSDALEGGTLLDRLVRDVPDVDVHAIRQDEPAGGRGPAAAPGPLNGLALLSGPRQYAHAIATMGAVAALCAGFEGWLGYRAVGFVLLLAVMGVGMSRGFGPTFAAAVLSAVGWNFFFIPPRFTFIINEPDDVILCASFLVVATILGYMTARIRRHETMLREREERSSTLYEILRDIANSSEKSEFLTKTAERVGRVLGADCGAVLADSDGRLDFASSKPYSPLLDAKEEAVATWAFRAERDAGWSTDTLAESPRLFVPLKGATRTVGVLALRPRSRRRLSLEQETLLRSVAQQLALSIERKFLEKRADEARRLMESEQLHQTLLNSISHEMRTPLTAVLGWASELEGAGTASPHQAQEIGRRISEAGERLNRVIGNLLDMSRVSSGVLELKKEWHDPGDLIRAALKRLTRSLEGRTVTLRLADDLPLVRADFQLIEHALANLVLNAAAYSPPDAPIEVSAERDSDKLRIAVDDGGPGVPETARARVFDKFYRVPGTAAGGTGLGLSLVKGIAEAHGGRASVGSSRLGGARFAIELPAGESPPAAPEGVHR